MAQRASLGLPYIVSVERGCCVAGVQAYIVHISAEAAHGSAEAAARGTADVLLLVVDTQLELDSAVVQAADKAVGTW